MRKNCFEINCVQKKKLKKFFLKITKMQKMKIIIDKIELFLKNIDIQKM